MASSTATTRLLPMFTPITAFGARRRSAFNRRSAALATSLLSPMRLITARSGTSRNSRGFGLPSCGIAVTVPISMCPKPSASSPRTPIAFLSKPAATPKGDGKVRPRARTCCSGPGAVSALFAQDSGGTPSTRMTAMAAWCANSGSRRERTWRKSSGYIPARLPVGGFLPRPRAVGTQVGDGALEVLQRVELLVHAREAEVRHLVELAQRSEDRESDLVRVELRDAGLTHRLLDLLREHGQVGLGDGAPLA